MKKSTFSHAESGFSLIEMAIVLAIVGLLMASLLPAFSGQIEQQRRTETRKQLEEIKEALLGYAIFSGRLPCPATAANHGVEKFASGEDATTGKCANFNDSFLPASTLGFSPTDGDGFAVDAWGNRIHYAVTQSNSKAFTKLNGMQTTGISSLTPDLIVCSTSSTSSSSCSVANTSQTTGAPFVIYSTGMKLGTGADESENPNPYSTDNDRVFVGNTPSSDFDDMVTWLSPNILFNRLIAAGRLP
ncbi:MAG: prepilin-type N-terminal cleavage/methylation domain-containing protein [Sideroxydans sp.]|nr:prepilin-type N-terminal cleavage/methylation domain-containing protein [Sideroxydans sp.]